jgi:hypothetical protein
MCLTCINPDICVPAWFLKLGGSMHDYYEFSDGAINCMETYFCHKIVFNDARGKPEGRREDRLPHANFMAGRCNQVVERRSALRAVPARSEPGAAHDVRDLRSRRQNKQELLRTAPENSENR